MSLIGRYLIDKFKAKLPRLTLPVPPYGDKNYWERVYKSLNVQDVYEWGDLTMRDLSIVKYKKIHQEEIRKLYGDNVCLDYHDANKSTITRSDDNKTDSSNAVMEEDFSTTIRVARMSHICPSILILGCGNSNLGEEIYHYYNNPLSLVGNNNMDSTATTAIRTTETPDINVVDQTKDVPYQTKILQCDVSPSVLNSMSQRCSHLPYMSFHLVDFCSKYAIQQSNSHVRKNDVGDNRSSLSSLPTPQSSPSMFSSIPCSSINAVIDKGLVDALFCSEKSQIPKVMMNVHQCLKAGSVFIFFSFSRPEYLLKETMVMNNLWDEEKHDDTRTIGKNSSVGHVLQGRLWSEVNVCQLEKIFMYQFVKHVDNGQDHHSKKIISRKSMRRRRRRRIGKG